MQIAFVIFERIEDKRRCIEQYRFKPDEEHLKWDQDTEIEVTNAIEPSNLVLENFDYSARNRFLRQIMMGVLLILMLIFCVTIIFEISKLGDPLPSYGDCSNLEYSEHSWSHHNDLRKAKKLYM